MAGPSRFEDRPINGLEMLARQVRRAEDVEGDQSPATDEEVLVDQAQNHLQTAETQAGELRKLRAISKIRTLTPEEAARLQELS
jgi:hypothetical protein